MMFFKIFKNRRLIKRFIELDGLIKALEREGCLKRSCQNCRLNIRVNEHFWTCDHDKYCTEMQDIYKKLFPNEPDKYTWIEKVERVKNLQK